MPIMKLLHSTIEHSVPDWVEQGRRLGGLLIGVGSQAGRPLSLAHEWAAIADEALASCTRAEEGQAETPLQESRALMSERSMARLRTHLTGLTAA